MTAGRSEFYFLSDVFSTLTRCRYIRSHMHLDDLERRARFPAVDAYGRETGKFVVVDQAGSHGQ